ncbi:hypothetical protein KUV47_10745 [Vannielia litorea]|uniref:hypothetical protein n=1 Tax=Vannielia TaxID=2813041 RepID=UPI001C944798|nr:hypothetical protein [Vannielia litorea]MBY6046401.1 hypothetical protein [Vannielia litorea]MBY6073814.1 hypothetical protein [Vannielia litorea]MBY6153691.1 hypothetical protein [Vannielia litorea]
MRHRPIGRVEDYTVPFLVSAGFTLFFGFMIVAALWGWGAVLLVSVTLDRLIARLRR